MADIVNSSCCDPNNGDKPGQPEYGKKYKPENNNGCGCPYGNSSVEVAAEPTIVIQRLTREEFA